MHPFDHYDKKAKRKSGKKAVLAENRNAVYDTVLYITEITIGFHATFQLSDNQCTLMHFEIISSGNNLRLFKHSCEF